MLEFPGMSADDVKVFLAEAEEQLQVLEDGLLTLEQEGEDEAVIADIFRAAHTLKGSSATLGHTRMAELTHSMESVLDGVRKSKIAVTSAVMDVLFECLDMLRLLNREIVSGDDSGADVSALTEHLLDIVECADGSSAGAKCAERDPASAVGAPPAAIDGAKCAESDHFGTGFVSVNVSFKPECPMPAVRAYQVVDRLSVLGRILSSDPSIESIEAGDDMHSLAVILEWEGESADELVSAVREVSDVDTVKVASAAAGQAARSAKETAASAEAAASAAKASSAGEPAGASAGAPTASAASTVAPSAAGAGTANGKGSPGGNGSSKSSSVSKSLSSTVRVDVSRLDTLSNLVAELVIDRTHLAQLESKLAEKHGGDETISELNRTSMHIGRITTELQEAINKARMLPIDNVFKRFPRMVRDLAQKQGKEIDLIIEGEDTELDRSVSEEIGDPIIHLLRNAVGHGIEPPEERIKAGKPRRGVVNLKAFHQGNYIMIQVSDDGRGIDAEIVKATAIRKGIISEEAAARLSGKDALNLIFASGLSTQAKADDVSGRGVGMDIVRKNLEHLNGGITIDTAVGKGSTFTVKLPLTLAIIRALLVSLEDKIYAVPLGTVEEITRVESSEIQTVRGHEAILLRGEIIPLVWLADVFSSSEGPAGVDHTSKRAFVVIASSHEGKVGLVVDSLVGEMEIVIKSLSTFIGQIPGVSGVTILGDGRVALIVDVPSLVRRVIEDRHVDE